MGTISKMRYGWSVKVKQKLSSAGFEAPCCANPVPAAGDDALLGFPPNEVFQQAEVLARAERLAVVFRVACKSTVNR